MTLPIKKTREIIFLFLYSTDLAEAEPEDVIELLSKELKVSKSHLRKAYEQMNVVRAKQDEIDAMITAETRSYEFKRIYSVERNILRLGIYEMLFDDKIPPKVAITEAMRLGKKFGTPASVAFINAIMDHLYKLNQGEASSSEEVSLALEELVENDKRAEEIELPDPDEQESE